MNIKIEIIIIIIIIMIILYFIFKHISIYIIKGSNISNLPLINHKVKDLNTNRAFDSNLIINNDDNETIFDLKSYIKNNYSNIYNSTIRKINENEIFNNVYLNRIRIIYELKYIESKLRLYINKIEIYENNNIKYEYDRNFESFNDISLSNDNIELKQLNGNNNISLKINNTNLIINNHDLNRIFNNLFIQIVFVDIVDLNLNDESFYSIDINVNDDIIDENIIDDLFNFQF